MTSTYWYPHVPKTPLADIPAVARRQWVDRHEDTYIVQRHLVAPAIRLHISGIGDAPLDLYLAVDAHSFDSPIYKGIHALFNRVGISFVAHIEGGWVDQFDEYHRMPDTVETIRKYDSRVWPGERHVLCAANRFELHDGSKVVVTGARHYSRNMTAIAKLLRNTKVIVRTQVIDDDQGFIDSVGGYLTRTEALALALTGGQVNKERNGAHDELYSEGLY